MSYNSSDYSLFTSDGHRKYLNIRERNLFRSSCLEVSTEIKTFLDILFWTGGRISEILNLKASNFNFEESVVLIETLKKRKKGNFRQVPIPPFLRDELEQMCSSSTSNTRLWSFSRRTGYRYVKKTMNLAKISGPMASPKGLRHSFAIFCLMKNVPITLVKKWLGHSSLNTTMIYADIIGDEELEIAQRLWH